LKQGIEEIRPLKSYICNRQMDAYAFMKCNGEIRAINNKQLPLAVFNKIMEG